MTDSNAFVGAPGDFAFLDGEWQVRHRRLRHRLAGSSEWDELIGGYRGYTLADGGISVDEFRFPDGSTGCTFRALDLETRRWSIWWVSSRDGKLGLAVHGGFDGSLGLFYDNDVHEGRPVKVRFIWRRPPDHPPSWEQAFSTDGEAWEVNWMMEFERLNREVAPAL